jgi:hypothetical protein
MASSAENFGIDFSSGRTMRVARPYLFVGIKLQIVVKEILNSFVNEAS